MMNLWLQQAREHVKTIDYMQTIMEEFQVLLRLVAKTHAIPGN